MTVLRIPPERDLPSGVRGLTRARLVAEVHRASSRRHPNWFPRTRRFLVVAIAAVGLALAAAIPSIGVGEILRAVGVESSQPPPYVQREQDWREALTDGAATDPTAKFNNLPPHVLRARLEEAGAAHNFRVVSVEFLKPLELAPMITVSTVTPAQFAAFVPELMRQIDPKTPGDDATGWTYEGIFIKALDRNENPFLVIDNHWRGDHSGGGQWARSDLLLPYAHG